MAKVNRVAYDNLLMKPGVILVPSSEEPSMTRQALLRPKIADVLRFRVGWTIRAGENDKIDFAVGLAPDQTATVAAGKYPTGAAMAEAVRVAEFRVQLDGLGVVVDGLDVLAEVALDAAHAGVGIGPLRGQQVVGLGGLAVRGQRGFAPPVRFLCPPEICVLDLRLPAARRVRAALTPASAP